MMSALAVFSGSLKGNRTRLFNALMLVVGMATAFQDVVPLLSLEPDIEAVVYQVLLMVTTIGNAIIRQFTNTAAGQSK